MRAPIISLFFMLPLSLLALLASPSNAQKVKGLLRKNNELKFAHSFDQNVRKLKSGSKKSGTSGGGSAQNAGEEECKIVSDDEECVICSKENKVKPVHLTLEYRNGTGMVSKYQGERHASCRNQDFPNETVLEIGWSRSINVTNGTVFEMGGSEEKLSAETWFTFDANGFECHIHTSCSAPLVQGDQIGPFVVLAGTGCCAPYCGDGKVGADETCDPADSSFVPATGMGECREDCTYCGDGFVNGDEECDEGTAMPTTTCNACKKPYCGDGVKNGEETCDPADSSFVPASEMGECREDCTYCGDGIVNGDEECDGEEGCNPDCTWCRCDATATYNPETGGVSIDFDFCGDAEPRPRDFFGIYNCSDTSNMLNMTEEWIEGICNEQGSQIPNCTGKMKDPAVIGYVLGENYTMGDPYWETYTCGGPNSTCSHRAEENTTVWPSKGTVKIEPSMKTSDNRFAFSAKMFEEPKLPSGCYKVLIQRDITADYISAPPYPTVCYSWDNAPEFYVT